MLELDLDCSTEDFDSEVLSKELLALDFSA